MLTAALAMSGAAAAQADAYVYWTNNPGLAGTPGIAGPAGTVAAAPRPAAKRAKKTCKTVKRKVRGRTVKRKRCTTH